MKPTHKYIKIFNKNWLKFSSIFLIVLIVFAFIIKKENVKYIILLLLILITLIYVSAKKNISFLKPFKLYKSLNIAEKTTFYVLQTILIGIATTIFTSILFPGYEIQIVQYFKALNETTKKTNETVNKTYEEVKKIVPKDIRLSEYLEKKETLKDYKKFYLENPNDIELRKKINQLEKELVLIKEIAGEIAKITQEYNIDYGRLKKVYSYLFSKGNIDLALQTLNEHDLIQDQNKLLVEKENTFDSIKYFNLNKKLKYNSDEFVTRANLLKLQLKNNSRLELIDNCFKLSKKSFISGNLHYAKFLTEQKKFKQALMQYDEYVNNYQNLDFDKKGFNLSSLSYIYFLKALHYSSMLDSENAVLFYKKAIQSTTNNKDLFLYYGNLGGFYFDQGKILLAKKHLNLSLQHFNLIKENDKILFPFNSVLAELSIEGDIKKAEKLITVEIERLKKYKDVFHIELINARYTYAKILFIKKEYSKALEELLEIEKFFKNNYIYDPLKYVGNYSALLMEIAKAYHYLNKTKLSKKSLNKALKLIQDAKSESNDITLDFILGNTHFAYANLYVENQDKKLAMNEFIKTFDILKPLVNNNPNKIEFTKLYIKVIVAYYRFSKDAYAIGPILNLLKQMEIENPNEVDSRELFKFGLTASISNNLKNSYFLDNSYFKKMYKNEPTSYEKNTYITHFEPNEDISYTIYIQDTLKKNLYIVKFSGNYNKKPKHNNVYN